MARTPVSLPMIYLAGGMLLPLIEPKFARIDVLVDGVLIERLAEMAVIVALTGAGLKLDRPPGLRAWRSTWRLLIITMPLCIAALAAGAAFSMSLPLAAAVLLGASLAPTDPVLASGVQVGPPGSSQEGEVSPYIVPKVNQQAGEAA